MKRKGKKDQKEKNMKEEREGEGGSRVGVKLSKIIEGKEEGQFERIKINGGKIMSQKFLFLSF